MFDLVKPEPKPIMYPECAAVSYSLPWKKLPPTSCDVGFSWPNEVNIRGVLFKNPGNELIFSYAQILLHEYVLSVCPAYAQR